MSIGGPHEVLPSHESSASLSVFWEIEPGTEIRPQSELPDPREGVDEPEVFAGFLDAVRWGAIASADPSAFQSPFRAGIDIEDRSTRRT